MVAVQLATVAVLRTAGGDLDFRRRGSNLYDKRSV
ncbi:hypothetical protein OROHE_006430 [Orobanche hederae]